MTNCTGYGEFLISYIAHLSYSVVWKRYYRVVKIPLRQRQRVRERNVCVLTSSFLVCFLGSYIRYRCSRRRNGSDESFLSLCTKNVSKTTAIFHCRSRTRCRCHREILTSLLNRKSTERVNPEYSSLSALRTTALA